MTFPPSLMGVSLNCSKMRTEEVSIFLLKGIWAVLFYLKINSAFKITSQTPKPIHPVLYRKFFPYYINF